MSEVSNDFESGVNAADLSTDGNTAGKFDSYDVTGASSVAKFTTSNVQHGSLAARFRADDSGSAGKAYGIYTTKVGTITTHYSRIYGRFVALPASARSFLEFNSSGSGDTAIFKINSAGTVTLLDFNISTVWTSTVGMLSGVDFRMEIALDQSQSGGSDTCVVTVFTGANKDGTTPDFTSGTINGTFANNSDTVRLGCITNTFDVWELVVDDIVFGATSAVGPVEEDDPPITDATEKLRISRSNLRHG
jgi:hypothetical protein